MKNSLPPRESPPKWIRYEAQGWLVLALRLQPLAELAHRRLADLCWSGAAGDLDTGPQTAELCKVPRARWPGVLRELRAAGWRIHNGRLEHPAVLHGLKQAYAFQHERQRVAGTGGSARWCPKAEPAVESSKEPPAHASSIASSITSDSFKHVAADASSIPTVNDKRTVRKNGQHGKEAERLSLSSESPEKASPEEARFMATLAEVFGACGPKAQEKELSNWGGWWRNRYREDPRKADRVLAELRSMLREHRVRRNPGAAAMDLWKRFALSAG